jgi:hypothetical protein
MRRHWTPALRTVPAPANAADVRALADALADAAARLRALAGSYDSLDAAERVGARAGVLLLGASAAKALADFAKRAPTR